jgi:GT2 family glycosyltransferase
MERESDTDARTSVVIATHDRRDQLLQALERLVALPERPPIVVVDNGSSDGTSEAVTRCFPQVALMRLSHNRGAPARNLGASAVDTPYVAFADDDSWWAPGSLRRAADHLDRSPRLAVLQARILVGPAERLDPVCAAMSRSPLPDAEDLPGPPLLGFVACGAVVRRDAFLAVGGFDDLLFFLGEEQLVAQDLAAAGWALAYAADVVAHHHPSAVRDPAARRTRQVRNDLLSSWMRRPLRVALGRTASSLRRSLREPLIAVGVAQAVVRMPAALRRRRRLPDPVEMQLMLLERPFTGREAVA